MAFYIRHTEGHPWLGAGPPLSKLQILQRCRSFHPSLNMQCLVLCFSLVLTQGQCVTKYYRWMQKNGGYIWIQSSATIAINAKNANEKNIIWVNYLLRYISKFCLIPVSVIKHKARWLIADMLYYLWTVSGVEMYGNSAFLSTRVTEMRKDQSYVSRDFQGRPVNCSTVLGQPTFGRLCRSCFGFPTIIRAR